jgi:hypothetical protein
VKYAFVQNGALSIDKYAFSPSLRCVIAPLEAKDALENGDLPATQYCFGRVPFAARYGDFAVILIAIVVVGCAIFASKWFATKTKNFAHENVPLIPKDSRGYLP